MTPPIDRTDLDRRIWEEELDGFVPRRVTNSRPVQGDPYVGVGPGTEGLISLAKLGVHGLAQGLACLSGERWLLGPSLEAWGYRDRAA